jgi:hypothetical protein
LNLAQNSPAPVFRLLPGFETPLTPAPQNFGAHMLQRHRESLITRVVDVGVGHNPDKTVVQPASANLSENRVDLTASRAEQIEQERRLPAEVSNSTRVAPSALALTASQPPMSSGPVGDIPLHSGLEAAGSAPEIVAQPVIQRESDSAIPVVEGGAPVVPAKSGMFDGVPTRTHRIPEVSDSHTATSYTLAALPRGLSSNELDKPRAALQRLDRSAIRGPSTLERAPRVHVVNDRQMNMPSVTVSRSREEARAVSPSSTTHVGPSSILPAVQTTSQEHDSPHTGGHAGSSFFPSVHGASLLHNMVHRSSLNTVQDRAIQLRQPSLSPFRSVSLTHRAAPIMDGLQRSPASAAIGSHFLARQSDGSAAPSTVTAAVPLPSASSATYQAWKASQSFKNVDVSQLANRVYDLLVRRLASERQRRGL